MPALRAVTEDLILFRFLDKTGTPEKRDMVIRNLMLVDVHEKLDHQSRFFGKFRSFQPVLSRPVDSAQQIKDAKDELADYWRDYGWQGFAANKAMPPIRELAEKSDHGLLEVVYDFVYRLASGVGLGGRRRSRFRFGRRSRYAPLAAPIWAGLQQVLVIPHPLGADNDHEH